MTSPKSDEEHDRSVHTTRALRYPPSLLDSWRPAPEDQMHRGRHVAVAVRNSAPGIIGLVFCDDRGTSAGFNLSIWGTDSVVALLQQASRAASTQPRASDRSE